MNYKIIVKLWIVKKKIYSIAQVKHEKKKFKGAMTVNISNIFPFGEL